MQSDGNSFFGDVVLDSFNKASRGEDDILDQIYKSKYVWIIFRMILILSNYTKMPSITTAALKPNSMSSFLFMCCISYLCIFFNPL